MKDVGFVVFVVFILLIFFGIGYGAGWVCGNETTITETKQTLCREFMKETNNYINCNTKELNEIIKLIKEQTNEK